MTLGSYYGALNGQLLVAGEANNLAAVATVSQTGQVTNPFSSATASLGEGQISGAARRGKQGAHRRKLAKSEPYCSND